MRTPIPEPLTARWSVPEAERDGRPRILLLHGHGSDEADLLGLAPGLPERFALASLRAPYAEGPGFTWYPGLTQHLDDPPQATLGPVLAAVFRWLDALPPAPATAVLGFSQGGAIAVELARAAPERLHAVVTLSSFVLTGEQPGDTAIGALPVFAGRGDADDRIPHAVALRSDVWLAAHTALQAHRYAGLPHAISGEELGEVRAFLDEAVPA